MARKGRVFLCHNSRDKEQLKPLALALLTQGSIRTWLDSWEIPGGDDWAKYLRREFAATWSCLVLLGASGFGPYQRLEIAWAKERQAVDPEYRVIPLLLPGLDPEVLQELEILLPQVHRIDLRGGWDSPGSLAPLFNALRGDRPGPPVQALTVAVEAERWDQTGRKEKSLLIRGRALREAQTIANQADELDELSLLYLAASASEQQRRTRWGLGALAVAVLGLIGAVLFVNGQRVTAVAAKERESKALGAERVARQAEKLALDSERSAKKQAEKDRDYAQKQEAVATEQRDLAQSRALAAQSRLELEREQGLALLLAAAADDLRSTDASRSSLAYALDFAPTEFFLYTEHPAVSRLAALPGSRLATCDWRGSVGLWDLNRRRLIASLHTEDGPLLALAASPNGKKIVAGGTGRTVSLLTVEGGLQVLHRYEVPGSVRALAWLSERQVAVAADGMNLGVLDLGLGQLRPLPAAHLSPPNSLVADREGSVLVSAGLDHRLVFWQIAEEGLVAPETIASKADITSLALSPDRRTLAVGTHEHGVEIWDYAQRKPVRAASAGQADGRVMGLAFSPDSQILLWGGDEGVVNGVDMESRRQFRHPVHADALLDLCFSADGRRLLSAGREGKIWVGLRNRLSPRAEELLVVPSRTWITAVVSLGNTGKLAVGNGSGEIRVIDPVHRIVGRPVAAHRGGVQALLYRPETGLLLSTGADRTLRHWDLRSNDLESRGAPVTLSVAVPIERLLPASHGQFVWICADGVIGLGKDHSQKLSPILRLAAEQKVSANGPVVAAMDPQESLLALSLNRSELWVFGLQRGTRRHLTSVSTWIADLGFEPANGRLYAAHGQGIDVWDPVKGSRLLSISTGVRPLSKLLLTAPADLLISLNTYCEITFWGLAERLQIGPWLALPGVDVTAVLPATGPHEGVYTLTRSYDSDRSLNLYHLYHWATDVRSWKAMARKVANRELTAEERRRFSL